MPGYIVLLIDIENQEAFGDYARRTQSTMNQYRGHIALRGPIVEVVEGDLQDVDGTRLVVAEFESLGDARAWWNSPEYRPLVALRQPPVARTRAVFVDGVDLGR